MHSSTKSNKEKELLKLSNHELSDLECTNRKAAKSVSSDTTRIANATNHAGASTDIHPVSVDTLSETAEIVNLIMLVVDV